MSRMNSFHKRETVYHRLFYFVCFMQTERAYEAMRIEYCGFSLIFWGVECFEYRAAGVSIHTSNTEYHIIEPFAQMSYSQILNGQSTYMTNTLSTQY